MERTIRVVVAKVGLDGHDRGAKIIARALRDAGMEVIYTGLHQTPEQVVEASIQEDADVIVFCGGTIPKGDIAKLKELGVGEVFTPGTPTKKAVEYLRGALTAERS